MRVATAFQIPKGSVFGSITIDATALYALAAPDVPQPVRDEAVELAKGGEKITKQRAERLVAEAEAQAEAKLRDALATEKAAAEERLQQALSKAEHRYTRDTAALTEEVQRIKDQHGKPDVDQAVGMF